MLFMEFCGELFIDVGIMLSFTYILNLSSSPSAYASKDRFAKCFGIHIYL